MYGRLLFLHQTPVKLTGRGGIYRLALSLLIESEPVLAILFRGLGVRFVRHRQGGNCLLTTATLGLL